MNSALGKLWLRLMALGVIALVFIEGVELASGKALGWTFYLTRLEVAFEVSVRLLFAALVGLGLGTLCAAIASPFFAWFPAKRAQMLEWLTKAAIVAVLFLDSRYALTVLIKWSYQISEHRGIFDMAAMAAFYLAFLVALCLPRLRKELLSSLDAFLSEKATRAIAVGAVVALLALAGLEFVLNKTAHTVRAAVAPAHGPKGNILLVTFDALSAEDMSLYGYKLPTTPNMDAFARHATVFTNYYAASTFTTPCITTMLTGEYPSETRVYQLQGRISNPENTLPHAMRTGGFTTAAFFSNPYAYYLAQSIESEYDFMPLGTYQPGWLQRLWTASAPLHQNSGFGNRIEEYLDLMKKWNMVAGLPENIYVQYRAADSFQQGRKLIGELPDGFFLWVHVMNPHGPYFPDAQERGRFLDAKHVEVFEGKNQPKWKPHYPAGQQAEVDKYRLRYDEFVMSADRAFGSFISGLERNGKLQNTTVIVSADHGESFEGGIYQHGNPELTRPVIHVPLIIKTPGQQQSSRVDHTADQTALAPTILELAGGTKPAWMHGESLVAQLKQTSSNAKGLAFTQYLEINSVFKPLRHGSVGVVDGQFQYVLDLATQKGMLRPLSEAESWNLDRSADAPAKAQELRSQIYTRFPELQH